MNLRMGLSSSFFALVAMVSTLCVAAPQSAGTQKSQQLRAVFLQRDRPQRRPTSRQGLGRQGKP